MVLPVFDEAALTEFLSEGSPFGQNCLIDGVKFQCSASSEYEQDDLNLDNEQLVLLVQGALPDDFVEGVGQESSTIFFNNILFRARRVRYNQSGGSFDLVLQRDTTDAGVSGQQRIKRVSV